MHWLLASTPIPQCLLLRVDDVGARLHFTGACAGRHGRHHRRAHPLRARRGAPRLRPACLACSQAAPELAVSRHRLHRRCKPALDALRRSAEVPSLSGAAGGGALRAPARALSRGQAPEPGAQLRRQAGGAPGRRGGARDLQPSVRLARRRSDRNPVPRPHHALVIDHVCRPCCNA